MSRLKLYYLDNKYVDFLRKSDPRVAYNKNQTRPYIGVVYTYNDFKYFAPLSSPKPKHLKMNSRNIDIFKIRNGELGIINLNNMIPVPEQCLIDCFSKIDNSKYKTLLENQINYINKDRQYLLSKVDRFQTLYRKSQLPEKVYQRTCNFELLEQKCLDYQKENLQGRDNKGMNAENPIEKYCSIIGKNIEGRQTNIEKKLEK